MNLDVAASMARELMDQHGLAHWSFKFDRAARRFGSCQFTRRTITLSWKLTLLNDPDEVRDTVLHEIAHALAPGDGHGRKWKAACIRVGAKPERCFRADQVTMPARREGRFELGCTRCNWWVSRSQMRLVRGVCKHCRGEVLYREKQSGQLIRVKQVGRAIKREPLPMERKRP